MQLFYVLLQHYSTMEEGQLAIDKLHETEYLGSQLCIKVSRILRIPAVYQGKYLGSQLCIKVN